MHDLKRNNKRRPYNKQMTTMQNIMEVEDNIEVEDLDRGCKKASTNSCGCNEPKSSHSKCEKEICKCECVCKPTCEPCEIENDNCVENPCKDQCCCGITPSYSTRNAQPVAIEVERLYDAVQFQIFTDAAAPNGEDLYFDYEVVEVDGRVPLGGLANVVIDEVCMNYSSLEIEAGQPTVEDFEVEEIENNCDTEFEYIVCPERNRTCCQQSRGQSAAYKEKGLKIIATDLVLELKGHCGCTKIVAYAYPVVRRLGGDLCRVPYVEFKYNTLAARICLPADNRPLELRQDYKTALTVDCISKAFISVEDYCGSDCDDCFELTIPSGIDLICCVEETVSVLINDRIVVLGVPNEINPRVVDTFSKVCKFSECGDN